MDRRQFFVRVAGTYRGKGAHEGSSKGRQGAVGGDTWLNNHPPPVSWIAHPLDQPCLFEPVNETRHGATRKANLLGQLTSCQRTGAAHQVERLMIT